MTVDATPLAETTIGRLLADYLPVAERIIFSYVEEAVGLNALSDPQGFLDRVANHLLEDSSGDVNACYERPND